VCAGSLLEGQACYAQHSGDILCETGICAKSVCSTDRLTNGETCDQHRDCDSFICVQGNCAAHLLDVGSLCFSRDECFNYVCGVAPLNGTNTTSDRICCPSNRAHRVFVGNINGVVTFDSYCSYIIPTGQQCLSDESCQSGTCIKETPTRAVCSDQRLPDGATCYNDNDCQNYGCAHSTIFPPNNLNSRKCCLDGFQVSVKSSESDYDVNVCSGTIPIGQACGDSRELSDIACESGFCDQRRVCSDDRLANEKECDRDNECQSEQCAIDTFDPNFRKTVCCEQTIQIYDDGITNRYLDFCSSAISHPSTAPSAPNFAPVVRSIHPVAPVASEAPMSFSPTLMPTLMPTLKPTLKPAYEVSSSDDNNSKNKGKKGKK